MPLQALLQQICIFFRYNGGEIEFVIYLRAIDKRRDYFNLHFATLFITCAFNTIILNATSLNIQ